MDAELPRHSPKGPPSQESPGPSSVDVVLPGPAEPPAVRPGAVESRTDPLPDQLALELRDSRQDVEQEPAGRRGGVDRLVEHDEIDAQGLELLGHRDEVPDAPSEAVELHARDHIDLAALGGLEERVEGGPACLGPRDPAVDVLGGRPASGLCERPERLELGLGGLPGFAGARPVETRAYSATRVILTSLGLPSASARC